MAITEVNVVVKPAVAVSVCDVCRWRMTSCLVSTSHSDVIIPGLSWARPPHSTLYPTLTVATSQSQTKTF